MWVILKLLYLFSISRSVVSKQVSMAFDATNLDKTSEI